LSKPALPARRMPTLGQATRLVAPVVGPRPVVGVEPLAGGLRNSHFKLHVEDRAEPVVLRFYGKDPSVCRKEVALLNLVKKTVPVPEVLHAEAEGIDDSGPFTVLEYCEGVTLQELWDSRKLDALRQTAASVGSALTAIGRFQFSAPGQLGDALEVKGPFVEGPDAAPKFLDSCLASPHFQLRAGPELTERVHELGWSWREQLATLDEERALVHGDFNAPNLLAREIEGKWKLVAVLDWEFGFSGSPLFDVGNFLRYERADERRSASRRLGAPGARHRSDEPLRDARPGPTPREYRCGSHRSRSRHGGRPRRNGLDRRHRLKRPFTCPSDEEASRRFSTSAPRGNSMHRPRR
jgi:Ser/Thr protein kinase RdoA (MazF antagonist)